MNTYKHKSVLLLSFIPELFIEIFLKSFKSTVISLLPLVVVLKLQLNRTADFDVLSDEAQGQF